MIPAGRLKTNKLVCLGAPMRIAVIAALLLIDLYSCAWAQQPIWDRLLPPEEFDRPFDGQVSVWIVTQDHIRRHHCPKAKFNMGFALACAQKIVGTCYIFKVTDDELKQLGFDPDVVMRHEIGHCNGWRSDHRGAR